MWALHVWTYHSWYRTVVLLPCVICSNTVWCKLKLILPHSLLLWFLVLHTDLVLIGHYQEHFVHQVHHTNHVSLFKALLLITTLMFWFITECQPRFQHAGCYDTDIKWIAAREGVKNMKKYEYIFPEMLMILQCFQWHHMKCCSHEDADLDIWNEEVALTHLLKHKTLVSISLEWPPVTWRTCAKTIFSEPITFETLFTSEDKFRN